jgi:HlyD family secretion protein
MRAPSVLVLFVVLVLTAGTFAYWSYERANRLPAGFASANGRIEVQRVDIASKLVGRVDEIRVDEGDFVEKGTIIAQLDTSELQAQLDAAKASVQRAIASINRAKAEIAIREAEHQLAEVELERAVELQKRAAGTVALVDQRKAEHAVTEAQIRLARAALEDAAASRAAAEAEVAKIEATRADSTLHTPVSGRVEYKLVQPGEVVAAGGRLVTILDLTDVFMTIFLPTAQAGRLALGSEARIVLDADPTYVIPVTVSFVAAEAQFTPKTVETEEEREKLMYRVKLAIDPTLLETYRKYVKAGLTGNAYVRLDPDVMWPAHLEPNLPDVPS